MRVHNEEVKHTLMARRQQQRQWAAQLTDAEQAWEQADAEGLQLAAQVQSLRRTVQVSSAGVLDTSVTLHQLHPIAMGNKYHPKMWV